jgi:hypothetical protein
VLAAVLFCAAGVSGSALGQISPPSRFTSDEFSMIDARRFVNEPSNKQFRVSQSLELTPQATASAVAEASGDWRARVFALPVDAVQPRPYAFFDPCDVYLSSVIFLHSRNDGQAGTRIVFGPLGEDWLSVTSDRRMQAARHLIVFERAAPGPQRELGAELFRLERGVNGSRRDRYFGSGIVIEVTPGDRALSAVEIQRVVEQMADVEKKAAAAARDNAAAHRCYRIQVTESSSDDSTQSVLLAPCDPEEAPSDG